MREEISIVCLYKNSDFHASKCFCVLICASKVTFKKVEFHVFDTFLNTLYVVIILYSCLNNIYIVHICSRRICLYISSLFSGMRRKNFSTYLHQNLWCNITNEEFRLTTSLMLHRIIPHNISYVLSFCQWTKVTKGKV